MKANRKELTEPKTAILKFRVTPAERDLIERKALGSDRTVSRYLRDCALGKEIVVVPGIDAAAEEMRRIGNNLNQLTRYFHMGGLKSQAMTDELTRCINEIMKMRKDVMEMAGEYRGYTQTHRK